VFAIIILSIIAVLYRSEHEEFPSKDPKGVSGTIFTAVIVYAVRLVRPKPPAPYHRVTNERSLTILIMQAFFVCCGLQGLLHVRESRRGAITLS
jgi:hypothetical protein